MGVGGEGGQGGQKNNAQDIGQPPRQRLNRTTNTDKARITDKTAPHLGERKKRKVLASFDSVPVTKPA